MRKGEGHQMVIRGNK